MKEDPNITTASPHWPFIHYLNKAIDYIAFVKDMNGTPLDQITPLKRVKKNQNPNSQSKAALPDVLAA